MTATLADYPTAAQFRDIMKRVVSTEVEKLRPRYRYAVVDSIDTDNHRCYVVFPGETQPQPVAMGSTVPAKIGQVVRVDGLSGDRFLADVMGPTTVADTPTVPAPADLVLATAVDNYGYPQITVTWTRPDDPLVVDFEVRLRVAGSGAPWEYRRTAGATTITASTLRKTTTYEVEVRSITRYGNVSDPVSGQITTDRDRVAPVAPVGPNSASLDVYASYQTIRVRWADNTEPDVANGAGTYHAQLATDSGFTSIARDQYVAGTATSFVGLADSTTYWTRVAARDSDGNEGPWSAVSSVATPAPISRSDGLAPASSPTPTVKGYAGFLYASWTPVTNPDPVSYEVHVSATSGFTPSSSTKFSEVSATTAVISSLPGGTAFAYGTTYYVKLVAKDADGSAPAGPQGSASMVQIVGVDISDNAITAGSAIIGTGAITSAMIATLAADKITAGQIGAQTISLGSGGIIKSYNFVSGEGGTGWQIDGNGNLEANNATFRGSLATSTITGWLTTGTGGGFRTAASGVRLEMASAYTATINGYTGSANEVSPGLIQWRARVGGYGETTVSSPVYFSGTGNAILGLQSSSSTTPNSFAYLRALTVQLMSQTPTGGVQNQFWVDQTATRAISEDFYAGSYANGSGSGTTLHMGSMGQTAYANIHAEGAAVDVGMVFKQKGAGSFLWMSGNTTLMSLASSGQHIINGASRRLRIAFDGTFTYLAGEDTAGSLSAGNLFFQASSIYHQLYNASGDYRWMGNGGGVVFTIQSGGNITYDGTNVIRDGGGGWVRVYGTTGIYWQAYGGGWTMTDSTWLRAYGGKSIYTSGEVRADSQFSGSGGGQPVLARPSWNAISLQNGWRNYGAGWEGARFTKDANGWVHIEGLITGGTFSTGIQLFTLPAGYRPANYHMFTTVNNGTQFAVSMIWIDPNGNVTLQATTAGGGNSYLSLDQISFFAG